MITVGGRGRPRKPVSGQQSAVSRHVGRTTNGLYGVGVWRIPQPGTTEPLGAMFPHGLFAVHDSGDTPGDGDREGANFKLVKRP